MKDIETYAELLAETASNYLESMPYHAYDITSVRRNFTNLKAYFSQNVLRVIDILDHRTDYTDFDVYGVNIESEIKALLKETEPLQAEVNKLTKLHGELEAIITVSTNGKQAYKNLIATEVVDGFVKEYAVELSTEEDYKAAQSKIEGKVKAGTKAMIEVEVLRYDSSDGIYQVKCSDGG